MDNIDHSDNILMNFMLRKYNQKPIVRTLVTVNSSARVIYIRRYIQLSPHSL